MRFLLISLFLFLPDMAYAAEAKMRVRVKLIRMVTVEERQIACEKGYDLACRLLEKKPGPSRTSETSRDKEP